MTLADRPAPPAVPPAMPPVVPPVVPPGARFDGPRDRERRPGPAPILPLALAVVAVCLGLIAPDPGLARGLLTAAAVLFGGTIAMAVLRMSRVMRDRTRTGVLTALLAEDDTAAALTDDIGAIIYANATAITRFGTGKATLADMLRAQVALPGPLVFRLQSRAAQAGRASEDILLPGGPLRLSVRAVGGGQFLWRLGPGTDTRESATALPLVTVGRNGAILAMNDAARLLSGGRHKALDALFNDLPIRTGQVHHLRGPEGLLPVLVWDRAAAGGRRDLFLFPAAGVQPLAPGLPDWTVLDRLPVPALRLSPDGAVQDLNPAARDILGPDARAGQPLAALMEGLGRAVQDWLDDIAAGRGTAKPEFLRLKRADHEVFVQVSMKRMEGPLEGQGILAILTDATDLKSLEAQFVQSQKMQAIGQLAGGVAHDFNNLLTAISGHCDLLLLRHEPRDEDFADLMQIRQNANRAAALVGQLLAFSRKQTLSPERLDLRESLSDLAHLLNRLVGERVRLVLAHDPALPPIRADKRQMEQVIMNLVVNARDAMAGQGEIRIETEALGLSEPMLRDRVTVPAGPYVAVRVTDAGCGIAPDKLQKIFEPFYTTKRTGEGTGLGLSTVYGIVKQSGGYVFVDSVQGQGTCFTLMFPAHEAGPPDAMGTGAAAPPPPATLRAEGTILLVEDEAPVRAFASRALRLSGYTVIEAETAETALALLEDPGMEIDLFVTDVVMPGKDGPTWVTEALVQRPGVGVVFVSGYAEDGFSRVRARIPNSVFLAKPFSLTELTDTVQRQLH